MTMLPLIVPQPQDIARHSWVEVKTSDTTTDYFYDSESIAISDSTTSAWVKKSLRGSPVYKLHRFVFECESKKFISCDSEILCTNIGDSVIDIWSKKEVRRRIFPLQLSRPEFAPVRQILEEVCRPREYYTAPIGLSH